MNNTTRINPPWFAVALPIALSLFFLSSCAKSSTAAASGTQATILLRNGGHYSGSIVRSSADDVTFVGDDNVTRTLDMRDVKAIEYGEAPVVGSRVDEPAPARRPEVQAYAEHENHYHPAESAIRTRTNQLRTGTQISVRTEETLDSGRAVEDQGFAAEVTRDVLDSDGDVVVPRGSNAQIVIRSSSSGGHFKGKSDLILDLRSISVDGRQYEVSTTDMEIRGRDGLGVNRRTGEFAGGGAAFGAIIGAIAGQGKGAAIGAGSGAAAGIGAELLTKGGSIRIPVETVLTFRLDSPIRFATSQSLRDRDRNR
jgi:hypothetical protein